MWFLYGCVFLCGVVLCAYYPWWVFRRARRMLAHLPSFAKYPVVGNIHLLMGKGSEYFLHQLNIMSRMIDVYMAPFVFWLGPLPCILLSAPEDVKTVTMAYPDKAPQYQNCRNVFGDGLLTCAGELWKYTSKKLSVAFSSPVVAGYQHIFNDHSRMLVEHLKTEVGKEPFDACKKYINWIALQTIYYATFGVPNTSEHAVTEEYFSTYEQLLKKYCKRSVMIHQYSDFIYSLTSDSKETARLADIINSQAERVINHRKKEREIEKINALPVEKKEENKPSFKPYIDILLDLNETDPVFTHKQIISELNSIIAAGHDTVANTLTMCLIMLGTHNHVQNKLYEEMKTVFGDSKRPVTKEDLALMPYCEAVINETLRLYPAAPICFRQAHKDLKLKHCTIPEGAMCGINMWGSLRSKHIWGEDAEVFRPERWLEDPDFNPFFIAFSYGKRSCLGKRYAMASLKTSLAHCNRELVFKANTKRLRMRAYVTLKAFAGHEVQVCLRESSS